MRATVAAAHQEDWLPGLEHEYKRDGPFTISPPLWIYIAFQYATRIGIMFGAAAIGLAIGDWISANVGF